MRSLRIGIVTDGLVERETAQAVQIANGGVGVYIYNLVKHLQLVDTTNEYFLIHRLGGKLDIYGNGRSCSVRPRPSWLDRIPGFSDRSCGRLAAELRLDLLHYPNQFGGAWLPNGLRRVVTLHDITPLLFPQFHPRHRVWAYRLLMRQSLRAADHVIVDSGHTRADLLGGRWVAESKVTVIPLAAAEMFRAGVRTPDFPQRYPLFERFILTIGVLEPRKNHALLIEALRRLHAEGERVGVVIVGRDGWHWTDPLADPAVAHLRPWVRIFRNVPDVDVVEFYNRADIFAYPSLYEGFGLPVIEAMACGTPVVTSRASSLPETAGEAALFTDPHDATELTDQLRRLLHDMALRERLRAAGRQHAAQLSWRRTAERTRAVYERLCAAADA